MLFNVPYIPDQEYTEFLAGLGESLHSVHFSLYSLLINDGRVRMDVIDPNELATYLKLLPRTRKYLLANGRFHLPNLYLRREKLSALAGQLSSLQEAGVLDGIVFSDAYLLAALAGEAPQLVSRLEAVPSINFILDDIGKISALMEMVEQNGFLPPKKLTLDRELNRKPDKLQQLATAIRERFPATKIELLANEGCLRCCPFRATHEALIAAANNGIPVDTLQLNKQLACVQLLGGEPYRILASPFIRPEDVKEYESVVDIIKICGRSLGPDFLMRTVRSYVDRKSPQNILSLLDAAHWMTENWELDRAKLPDDFYQLMTTCEVDCKECQLCMTIFKRAARPLPFQIKSIL